MSLSNVFLNALSNTLLGMGTVFVVLIIIIFVILLMSKAVRSIEGKGKEAEAPKAAAPAPVPAAPAAVEEETADDLELVAVITAAVAASMGSASTDGFVVRSIKRSKNRNW
ncbi:MAG: hypothetical protein HFI66_10345 [Lachnospiraceae bacterium]|jgi:sodium pump decarboxylase gamma subunit|nr:hypothetical protein [Lachnospiraceae bacterium]